MNEDLLQLSSGTSKQHVKLGKTFQNRNATEFLNNLFDLGDTNKNFVTGREASSTVNIFNTKEIGQAIVSKMDKMLFQAKVQAGPSSEGSSGFYGGQEETTA